mmetsp:Transcript_52114/g.151438  ORF Transcript_52114/g.151438 Transcript_52114/m.151438 type:complete len:252 (+) Transcript_52114:370-1125(+)
MLDICQHGVADRGELEPHRANGLPAQRALLAPGRLLLHGEQQQGALRAREAQHPALAAGQPDPAVVGLRLCQHGLSKVFGAQYFGCHRRCFSHRHARLEDDLQPPCARFAGDLGRGQQQLLAHRAQEHQSLVLKAGVPQHPAWLVGQPDPAIERLLFTLDALIHQLPAHLRGLQRGPLLHRQAGALRPRLRHSEALPDSDPRPGLPLRARPRLRRRQRRLGFRRPMGRRLLLRRRLTGQHLGRPSPGALRP